MRTLHLTLKKMWFDMIASGEKKEVYNRGINKMSKKTQISRKYISPGKYVFVVNMSWKEMGFNCRKFLTNKGFEEWGASAVFENHPENFTFETIDEAEDRIDTVRKMRETVFVKEVVL